MKNLCLILALLLPHGTFAIPPITGTTSVCIGSTTTLMDATAGGIWTSSTTAIATVNSTTGLVTGVLPGTAIISYDVAGVYATATVSVNPAVTPAVAITLSTGDTVCAGTMVTFTADPVSGAGSMPTYFWSVGSTIASSASAYAYVPGTGDVVTLGMVSSDPCRLSDTVFTSVTMDVVTTPTVTATGTPDCGGVVTLAASGATTYSWSPYGLLLCPSCATTLATTPFGSPQYAVIGSNSAGCNDTVIVSVNTNSIYGSVSFTGTMPDTLDMKVWLIQFNSSDSTLIAQDSVLTCLYSGSPYYEFDGVASGNYLVKGMLLHGNPAGASGYVPTYGLSSAYWYAASTVSHTSYADNLGINMIYGTVPSGPGFIGGLISSGAGRGASANVPAVGMQVYLKDAATNNILTYTYTDNTGAYSFSNLQLGSYVIYPENFDNYTTPSSIITLTSTDESVSGIDFIQHTTSKTIVPLVTNAVKTFTSNANINVYPNPTTGNLAIQWTNQVLGIANIVVTDVLGRDAANSVITINAASGQAQLDLSGLQDGIYFLTIKSDNIYYNAKLQILQ